MNHTFIWPSCHFTLNPFWHGPSFLRVWISLTPKNVVTPTFVLPYNLSTPILFWPHTFFYPEKLLTPPICDPTNFVGPKDFGPWVGATHYGDFVLIWKIWVLNGMSKILKILKRKRRFKHVTRPGSFSCFYNSK